MTNGIEWATATTETMQRMTWTLETDGRVSAQDVQMLTYHLDQGTRMVREYPDQARAIGEVIGKAIENARTFARAVEREPGMEAAALDLSQAAQGLASVVAASAQLGHYSNFLTRLEAQIARNVAAGQSHAGAPGFAPGAGRYGASTLMPPPPRPTPQGPGATLPGFQERFGSVSHGYVPAPQQRLDAYGRPVNPRSSQADYGAYDPHRQTQQYGRGAHWR